MKKTMILFLGILTLMTTALIGREEMQTLAQGHHGRSGFFGAPVIKITRMYDETGLLMGGRLGWNIDGVFSVGLAGYGWVNDYDSDSCWFSHEVDMGYGGFYLEGIVGSNKIVHLAAGVLIGAGAMSNADTFFVIEPEINVELNITRHFRIGAGVSYRFTSGVDHYNYKNDNMSGVAGTLTFKIGRF